MSKGCLFNGAIFNLLMNQYSNAQFYTQKRWTWKFNSFQRRAKSRDATVHATVLSIWSTQEPQCPGWCQMQIRPVCWAWII